MLGTAARAVNELYSALCEIEAHRQDGMQSLAIVDRVDYEIELEDGEAHEAALDRDPGVWLMHWLDAMETPELRS